VEVVDDRTGTEGVEKYIMLPTTPFEKKPETDWTFDETRAAGPL
jgi:hypothetical protein